MAGFANLINIKDEAAVSRDRRIQISQLGGGGGTVTSKLVREEMDHHGRGLKKRWSFHSSSQISDMLKEDKVMRPISSPNSKRRKSSGTALVRSASDAYTYAQQEVNHHHRENQHISVGKEQPRSSGYVLNARQSQSHHHRHHSYKQVPLGECEASSSRRRQRYLEECTMQVDSFPSDYKQFHIRKSKYSREPVAPDYLSPLPDKVLLRIFKNLPKTSLTNVARTSRRFVGLMDDDSLWKRVCVIGKLLNPEHLLIIMSRKPIYLRMARTYIPDPVDLPSDLTDLMSSSQLIYLDLSSAKISSSTLALMMKISPKLVKLSLEHLTITKEVMEEMMSFVDTIEVLNLTMCYDLDSKTLVKFLSSCQRLRELNLGCVKVDWGIQELTDVVSALPETVKQLNISGFRNLLDNSHVLLIATRCPKLIELDISDSQEVQAESIKYILRLSHLQHLGLSRCYGIDPPVYSLLTHHKSLKFIDLFSLFKDSSIRQLSSNMPGIEINKFPFSAIARPTVGNKRSSIWLQRVRN